MEEGPSFSYVVYMKRTQKVDRRFSSSFSCKKNGVDFSLQKTRINLGGVARPLI